MRRDATLPYLAFATCALIWGSTFLVIRFSNDALPALWGAALRLLLAAAFLFLICLVTRTPIPRGDGLKAAIGYGVLNFGISLALLYWGETALPSGLAAVLYATAPIASMLIARAVGLEVLDWRRLVAAGVALTGVGLISANEMAGGRPFQAIAAVLGSVVAAVSGSIVLKRGPKQSAIATNAVAAVVGGPLCLIWSVAVGERHPIPRSLGQLWPLLYLTIVGSVGAFVTMTWLLGRWKASSTSFIAVVIPVIAVVLGALFRSERFEGASLAGAVVVLGATAFVLRSETGGH